MMEGIKGGGGGRVGVGVGVEEDMGDGMQCSNHPYRNNPGGICAFCLQEKLGKLVSSSFPLPIRASPSSSSSPPSFRSDTGAIATSCGGNGGVSGGGGGGVATFSASSLSMSVRPITKTRLDNGNNNSHYEECYTRRSRIPFLLAKKKKKIMVASSDHHHHHHHHHANIALKRSKSTTAPRRGRFLDGEVDNGGGFSPRKRSGFWSFLYLSSKTYSSKKPDKVASIAPPAATVSTATTMGGPSSSSAVVNVKPKEKSLGSSLSRKGGIVVVEEDDSPNSEATASAASSFERKVSRSRSVGCGSRSFSGDFFERISTGLGDCTLRRVESQREGKPKSSAVGAASSSSAMKERVKCGGIFGGFIITSSSSSSSSSSYWLSSSAEEHNGNGKATGAALIHGRSRSWGWAFASPMRAFTKPSSGKKDATTVIRESNNKNTTPNLAAIPSLLAVRS
ncbi:hypothetical protein Gogos_003553 [Gossypium gossypioides]|uniref:Uncharacterized protein n=1 Tax=Gossypium gossypioides TaxID=34282 RepID=A0A7J9CMC2_GOSGO|nr:hypothetical protein [Gossypium gossypioides]